MQYNAELNLNVYISFRTNHYFFWIPILGQLCGAVLGAFIYVFTIEMHHPEEEAELMDEVDVNNSDQSKVHIATS